MRHFATPTKVAVEQLKRLVRYMVGAPRLVWHYAAQEENGVLDTYVDTDVWGCLLTRRSTSGGVAMHGTHTIKHWSNTQSTVALSSAEAELGGICKGASQGLGLQAIAKDLGLRWKLTIHADAAAAIGICKRRGLGKVRHLAVADLWVQDRIRKKDFYLVKVGHGQVPHLPKAPSLTYADCRSGIGVDDQLPPEPEVLCYGL